MYPIDQDGDLGRLFFDMLADIYLLLHCPRAIYHDWLSLAEDTVCDLKNKDCITKLNDLRYLNAYVGTGDRRPESLVQLTVMLPLLEYDDWSGKKIPLIDDLREKLPSFYDKQIGCIMRYPEGSKGSSFQRRIPVQQHRLGRERSSAALA